MLPVILLHQYLKIGQANAEVITPITDHFKGDRLKGPLIFPDVNYPFVLIIDLVARILFSLHLSLGLQSHLFLLV